MTGQSIETTLTEWQTRCLALESAWETFASATGIPFDSPLGDATWRLVGAYIDTVAELVGAPPSGTREFTNDVTWYAYETHYGQRNTTVTINGRRRKINNVKALAKLIRYSQKMAADHA